MARYSLSFAKRGYMVYTSHLDMQRLFKRAFKRADIALAYSQGYNPHPLMSFAQPLSLGYYSECELLEFKTKEDHSPAHIAGKISKAMPEGLEILSCKRMREDEKTLASRCVAAVYVIEIPLSMIGDITYAGDVVGAYLSRDEIIVSKRSKKKKEAYPVDIKNKIRSIDVSTVDDKFIMTTNLDAGSDSNLSPELFLQSFFDFINQPLRRESIDITRIQLICK